VSCGCLAYRGHSATWHSMAMTLQGNNVNDGIVILLKNGGLQRLPYCRV